MIGPFGYCADISRTFLCGDGEATPAQRDPYRHAYAGRACAEQLLQVVEVG